MLLILLVLNWNNAFPLEFKWLHYKLAQTKWVTNDLKTNKIRTSIYFSIPLYDIECYSFNEKVWNQMSVLYRLWLLCWGSSDLFFGDRYQTHFVDGSSRQHRSNDMLMYQCIPCLCGLMTTRWAKLYWYTFDVIVNIIGWTRL